jgi:hypothetical protein
MALLEMIDQVEKMRKEVRQDIGSASGDQKIMLDVTAAFDDQKLRTMGKIILQLLSSVVC